MQTLAWMCMASLVVRMGDLMFSLTLVTLAKEGLDGQWFPHSRRSHHAWKLHKDG